MDDDITFSQAVEGYLLEYRSRNLLVHLRARIDCARDCAGDGEDACGAGGGEGGGEGEGGAGGRW